jgi:hypothetical protein
LPIRVKLCERNEQSIWLLCLIVYSPGFLIQLGGFTNPVDPHTDPTHLDRLGVAFANGRTATTRDRIDMDQPPARPMLRRLGSRSSGPGRTEEIYWVLGIPPAGNLWLHYAWAGDGLRRHVIELDSRPIRRLAR